MYDITNQRSFDNLPSWLEVIGKVRYSLGTSLYACVGTNYNSKRGGACTNRPLGVYSKVLCHHKPGDHLKWV